MGKRLAAMCSVMNNNVRVAEFALTNVCTARCDFCAIWQQKKKHTVPTDDALAAIDRLSSVGVRYVTLTGGEPLLHPAFDRIVERCTARNITSSILNADARLLNDKRMDALAAARVDQVCISVDSHEDEVASKSRKIPNLLEHVGKAVRGLRERGVQTLASTLICTFNLTSLRQLFQRCTELGFDIISVNYPVFSKSPVYTIGGEAIKITKPELITALEEVISLKKEYRIVNSEISIRNIISYLKGEAPRYMCLGGYRTVFVDWHLDAYPCMYLGRGLGRVAELKKSDFRKVPCNACNMSWYRDFSIYFQGLKSLAPVVEGVRFLREFRFS